MSNVLEYLLLGSPFALMAYMIFRADADLPAMSYQHAKPDELTEDTTRKDQKKKDSDGYFPVYDGGGSVGSDGGSCGDGGGGGGD